jgi:uncharacterized membrane protein (DUF2068 family)
MLMRAQVEPSGYPVNNSHSLAEPQNVEAGERRSTSTMSTPATVKKHAHVSASERWVIAIGVLKLVKAVLFILLGIGAIKLLHKDLVDEVTHFIVDLRFDPEGRFVNLILEKVALINPHRLRLISLAIFAYAALDIIEGTGLVLRKTWAEYVTLILTASFLPWEMFEIFHHVTWLKIVLTLLNIAVVVYLAFYVQMTVRQRREHEGP